LYLFIAYIPLYVLIFRLALHLSFYPLCFLATLFGLLARVSVTI
jgi:hypothetical protein